MKLVNWIHSTGKVYPVSVSYSTGTGDLLIGEYFKCIDSSFYKHFSSYRTQSFQWIVLSNIFRYEYIYKWLHLQPNKLAHSQTFLAFHHNQSAQESISLSVEQCTSCPVKLISSQGYWWKWVMEIGKVID